MFFAELADALAAPTFTHPLALHVGHDGTLVRLLAGLGSNPIRWPSFGSEVVIEVSMLYAHVGILSFSCTGLGRSFRRCALRTRISRRHGSSWNGMGTIGGVYTKAESARATSAL